MDKLDFSLCQKRYYHSKWKKNLKKNLEMNYFNNVIKDYEEKNCVKYNRKYYSCCKFIRDLSKEMSFKKIKKFIFYLYIADYGPGEIYEIKKSSGVDLKNNCYDRCSLPENLNLLDKRIYLGKKISKCKNGCCFIYKKEDNFEIQWL
uniref:Uncharacterized protein n=1 Tax=viral metagenome TaxID=1070528 RepID=A0A6C0AEE0_9ZZZZ